MDATHSKTVDDRLDLTFLFVGVHNPRDDLAERTEQAATNHSEGDREDGEDHQQEVQHHPDAAQTIRLRVSDGPEVQVP